MAVGYLLKVGDKTACGGVILTGDSCFNIEGKPAATEGSQVSCGKNTGQFNIIGGVDFMNTPSGKSAGTLDSVSSCPCEAIFVEFSQTQRYGSSFDADLDKGMIKQSNSKKLQLERNILSEQDEYLSQPSKAHKEITTTEADIVPVINAGQDRMESILNDTPAVFEISENSKADSSKPLIEISLFNPIDSGVIYDEIGAKYGLDPGWLKSIAYMENTHGWYDGLPPISSVNTSYRPMNVQYKTWKRIADELGFNEWQVQYRVLCNVEVAAVIISRIKARVPDVTLEKVASIYNYIGKENVSDYGARVSAIYEGRLWEK